MSATNAGFEVRAPMSTKGKHPAGWGPPAPSLDNRRAVIIDWLKDDKTTSDTCKVCSEPIKTSSLQCQTCEVRLCLDCTDDDGKSNERYRDMAADYLERGCWCGIEGGFNKRFATTNTNRKRKHETPVQPANPFDFLYHAAAGRPPHSVTPPFRPLNLGADDSIPPTSSSSIRGPPPRKRTKHSDDNASRVERPADRPAAVPIVQSEPANLATKNDTVNIEQLEARTIVVVGAGVVGLFCALELASKAKSTGSKLKIIIVDINQQASCLASGNCAGLLTTEFMDATWRTFADTSLMRWDHILSSKANQEALEFSGETPEGAAASEKQTEQHVPSWLQDRYVTLCKGPRTTARRIKPKKTTAWLQKQCEDLGVQFRFDTRVRGVKRDKAGRLAGLKIQVLGTNAADPRETVACSSVILATGPFTPKLFSKLFPDSQLKLENHVQQVHQIRIRRAQTPANRGGIALCNVFREGYAGPLKIFASPDQGVAKLSIATTPSSDFGDALTDATRSVSCDTSTLLELAATYFVAPGREPGKARGQVYAEPTSFISTGNGGRPVIGKVPTAELGGKAVGREHEHDSDGVFLAYGFGNYGTTLAPLVGEVIAQIACGEKPSVDLGDFKGNSGVFRSVGVMKGKGKENVLGKTQGRTNGTGKGKAQDVDVDLAKSKGKARAKGKGKVQNSAVDLIEIKGKARAKGKGKAQDDAVDLTEPKGKARVGAGARVVGGPSSLTVQSKGKAKAKATGDLKKELHVEPNRCFLAWSGDGRARGQRELDKSSDESITSPERIVSSSKW